MTKPGAQKKRAPFALPIVAMVDAFVGGLATILVLIMVSQPSDNLPFTQPRADVILACPPDRQTPFRIFDASKERALLAEVMTPTEVFAPLTELSDPARMDLRVLIEAPSNRSVCADNLRSEFILANQARSAPGADARQPIFFFDVRYISVNQADQQ